MEERKRREEIEQQKWEAEQEERRRRELIEVEQLELKKRELQRQEARDKIDERKASAVAKGKLFGDAMRASSCHSDVRGSHRSHCIFPQRRTVVFCL